MLFKGCCQTCLHTSSSTGGGGSCVPGSNATAFLARGTFDATHTEAICTFINGLDTNSLYTKFDLLYLFAAENTTNALLNIPNATYNGISHGSPNFVSDRGFTGVSGSSTVYIDTGLAVSGGGLSFTQNNAHVSIWNNTNASHSGDVALGTGNSATTITEVYPNSAGVSAMYVNNGSYTGSGTSPGDVRGLWLASRTGSTNVDVYHNGSNFYSDTNTSGVVASGNLFILSNSTVGVATGGGAFQLSAASVGSKLTSSEEVVFYTLLRNYMTTVGVP